MLNLSRTDVPAHSQALHQPDPLDQLRLVKPPAHLDLADAFQAVLGIVERVIPAGREPGIGVTGQTITARNPDVAVRGAGVADIGGRGVHGEPRCRQIDPLGADRFEHGHRLGEMSSIGDRYRETVAGGQFREQARADRHGPPVHRQANSRRRSGQQNRHGNPGRHQRGGHERCQAATGNPHSGNQHGGERNPGRDPLRPAAQRQAFAAIHPLQSDRCRQQERAGGVKGKFLRVSSPAQQRQVADEAAKTRQPG